MRPFNYQIEPKELEHVVADALSKQYKNRRLLDVSKTNYTIVKAWRGIKNFFTKGVTRLFASSFYRDAKTGRSLKEYLSDHYDVTKRLGFVVPYKNKSLLNGNNSKRRKKTLGRRNNNDDESDESSMDDEDDTNNDNDDNIIPPRGPKKRPTRKGTNLDNLFQ